MSAGRRKTRRNALQVGLAGITGASLGAVAPASGAERRSESGEKVRYAELLPHEFRKRLADKPLAYIPLGTLEWHGEHLPIGSDALQSEGLMVECARRYGGTVLPPLHAGPGPTMLAEDGTLLIGMDFWNKVVDPPRQLDGDCYWIPDGLFISLVDAILAQCKRTGFRAVFADGHGPSRSSWVRELPRREAHFGLKLFGVTADIQGKWKSQIDH
ncbi:MAG: creatininase family protein, partial [Candidatus Latescibacterota bacterium]